MISRKVRVNISVDAETLERAKRMLSLFGGKLSTLFNAYLAEFVASREREPSSEQKAVQQKLKELEVRLWRLESKIKKRNP